MSYSDLIRSDRTSGQRAQDDEDHRQALCGLSFDAREQDELQDFYSRHSDFTIFALAPQARSRGQGMGGTPARRVLHALAPPPTSTTGNEELDA